MVTVERWTGVEARALRLAKRMSLTAFADHLGVSERTLSTWERRGVDVAIREVNQAALDTSLSVSAPDVHERFSALTSSTAASTANDTPPPSGGTELSLLRAAMHSVDSKQMALVDEGAFLSGTGRRSIWLPAFYIDVFPVTNREYMNFVVSTGHRAPEHWPRGRCPDRIFDHPVTYVTWHDAQAYASWAEKGLPTPQQWEKAARGTAGEVYPWGSQATPAKCNVRESEIRSTTPVNRYHSGVSPYGVYDLCGNVWEWCSSRTDPGRYHLKGGAFTSPFVRAAPHLFNDAAATMLDDDTGFRCVTASNPHSRPIPAQRLGPLEGPHGV